MRLLRRRRGAARPRRRRIRKLRLLLLVLVLGVLGLSSFTFGFVSAIAGEIAPLDPEKWREHEVNGYIYDSKGERVLAVLRGSESRVLVESNEISPWMKHAIVAIEDRRFYDHRGIDLRGIARALWADIRNQALVEGGSTITQQFVKNAYLRDSRSLGRKVREAALAWQLEQKWGKERILTAYLNTIYFGNGAYGIEQAALTYFRKRAVRLSLPEAALLAGIPADPASYDPVTRPGAAKRRREVVLQVMLEQGDISRGDFERARRAPLPSPDEVRLPGRQGVRAQYFTNYVKQQLVDAYGSRRVFGGGLKVMTTIDLGLQELANEAIGEVLTDPAGPSAALVAVDPREGDVLAMVGGRNFRESQFNLAVQGQRQPGSSFKPFVLATALEQGVAPITTFVSEPVTISLGDRNWVVHNYEGSYLGPVSLERATIHSDNSVYAQLTRLVRPSSVVRTAKSLGVQSPLRSYFSIGLGAQAANPLELARAYSAFANGGFRVDTAALGDRPRAIVRVQSEDGRIDEANAPVRRRVLREDTAGTVTSLLQRAVEQGTGKRATLPSWAVAGKTGTTENHGDAWFIGYTRSLVVAVWVGYPDRLRPMLTEFRGSPVAGGTYPALIWKSFAEKALPYLGLEPEPFAAPQLVSARSLLVVDRAGRVQLDNGLCRERFEVVYLAGYGPKQTADCKSNEVEVPIVVGKALGAARARLALQPLSAKVIYKPAEPGQRVDLVVDQFPRRGTLSSWDTVTLVMARPLAGLVPKVEGASVWRARALLRDRGLTAVVRLADGPSGQVVSQKPRAGVAAGKGMTVSLGVGRGPPSAAAARKTAG